jgi:hypothetical protein
MLFSNRVKKAILFFLVSFVLLYFFYATQDFLPKWDGYGYQILKGQPLSGYLFVDPLFMFIPLVGFAFMWVALSWYLRRFKDEQILSIPFALVFVVASYTSFFIAIVGYFWNNAFLVAVARGDPSPGLNSFGITWSFAWENFMDLLLKSPFFLFVLSAVLGWLSYILIHKYWNEKLPHVA